MESSLVQNSSDQKQVKFARAKERARAKRYEDDLAAVLLTANGRRVLLRVLENSGLNGEAAVPGDPHQTYFNCGMQRIGQILRDEILAIVPEQYFAMLKENESERRADYLESLKYQKTETEIQGEEDHE